MCMMKAQDILNCIAEEHMKLKIEENAALPETEIIIHCKQADAQIMKMAALLRVFDQKLTGTQNGETFLLEPQQILYIDTVDQKTFFYTQNNVYETPLKLYLLEERLAGNDFFRASKSSIVNFAHIQSLRPEFGGRLIATLTNGEKCFISRQYAVAVKQRLLF